MSEEARAEQHWIIRELIRIAKEQGRSLESVAQEAGRGRNTLYWWNRGKVKTPTLPAVDEVANVLGYELDLMKKNEEDLSQ